MKRYVFFALILFFTGCAHTDQTVSPSAPFPASMQSRSQSPAFQIPEMDEQPCVQCQFNEEEYAINSRIGKEIEQQRVAYERLIKEGMSEEEAVKKVYIQKNYK